jgi:formamidopyrimidine-DNA glycosylase
MPELPEVETVRRGLAPALVKHTFARVEQRRADLRFPLPQGFARRLEGRTVERLQRRAKYLLAHLSDGEVLLMHLGMTGRFTVCAASKDHKPGRFAHAAGSDAKHDHVVFHMESGATITYNDARRFGFMLLIPEAELSAHPLLRGLGVEPLGPGLTPD